MSSLLHRIGTKLFANDAVTIEISPQLEMDLSNVCRTCLQESEGRNELNSEAVFIIRSDGNLTRLCEMFAASTGLELTVNDKLPSHICDACLQIVKTSYSFRRQSQRAHEVLESVLAVIKPNESDNNDKSTSVEAVKEEHHQEAIEDHEEVIEIHEEKQSEESEKLSPEPAEEILFEFEKDMTTEADGEEEQLSLDELPVFENVIHKGDEYVEVLEIESLDNATVDSDADSSESLYVRKPQIYPCDYCQIKFGLQCDLIKHFRTSHPGEKPFKCQVCSMSFAHVQSMRRHVKIHQETAKDKSCPLCNRSFTRADDLTRHIRTHTDERPFKCKLCEKAFKQHTELNDHMLSHDDKKMYKCKLCVKEFRSRNGWYMHMKAHQQGKDRGRKRRAKVMEESSELTLEEETGSKQLKL